MVEPLESLPYVPGSETSQAAAERAVVHAPTDRLRILRAIRAAGSRGMTDLECQRITGIKGSTQRPRRGELFRMGLIRGNGEKRDRSAVWVAVGSGEQLTLI